MRDASILNVMEPLVANALEDRFVKTNLLSCACDKCRLDIVLLALNHLPPRYTSTRAGEAYIKALYQDPQLQSDILRELAKAVKVIEERPHH